MGVEKTMKISIIVAVYNGGEFLGECLDSLINQTYKNIEIVIVNDASTDNTKKIIQEYMDKDPRIIYRENKENMKTFETLNRGFEISTGDYITFCDADDWLDLKACELLLAKAIETNADMITSNHIKKDGYSNIYCFDAIEIQGEKVFKIWLNHQYRSHKHGTLIIRSIIQKYLEIVPRNIKLSHAEDFLMFCYIHFFVQYKIHITIQSYAYRQNNNSATQNHDIQTYIDRVNDYATMLIQMKTFLKNQNIYDQYEKEYIKTYNWHINQALILIWDKYKNLTVLMEAVQRQSPEIQTLYLEFLLKKVYFDNPISEPVIIKNKWYDFGMMNRKQKIKHIIKYILRKCRIYKKYNCPVV